MENQLFGAQMKNFEILVLLKVCLKSSASLMEWHHPSWYRIDLDHENCTLAYLRWSPSQSKMIVTMQMSWTFLEISLTNMHLWCWRIVHWSLRAKLQWNLNQNTSFLIKMHLIMWLANSIYFNRLHMSWISNQSYNCNTNTSLKWWQNLRLMHKLCEVWQENGLI